AGQGDLPGLVGLGEVAPDRRAELGVLPPLHVGEMLGGEAPAPEVDLQAGLAGTLGVEREAVEQQLAQRGEAAHARGPRPAAPPYPPVGVAQQRRDDGVLVGEVVGDRAAGAARLPRDVPGGRRIDAVAHDRSSGGREDLQPPLLMVDASGHRNPQAASLLTLPLLSLSTTEHWL